MTPALLRHRGVDLDECLRCGVRSSAPHENTDDCIQALRDLIAQMSFHMEKRRGRPAARHKDGQARPSPSFQHVVRLDGERMALHVAAGKLGISPSALYFRIRLRTGGVVEGADIRATGADVSRKPWLKARR